MLLSRIKLNECLCTIFSKTLPTVLSRDIGLLKQLKGHPF